MFNRLSKLKSHATAFLDKYKQQDPATYAAAQQAVGGLLVLDGFIGVDNPLGGRKRPGIFGTVVGIIVGLVFAAFGLFGGNLFGTKHLTAVTSGTVTAVGSQTSSTNNTNGGVSSTTTCSVTAAYTVNAKKYLQTSTMSSSSDCGLTAGSAVTVHYDPSNPARWASDTSSIKFILVIFMAIGLLVAITSFITFIIRLLSIIFGWKLIKSGRAMARTLPAGNDLGSMITSIRQEFSHSLFKSSASSMLGSFINNAVNNGSMPTPAQAVAQAPVPPTMTPTVVTPAAAPVNIVTPVGTLMPQTPTVVQPTIVNPNQVAPVTAPAPAQTPPPSDTPTPANPAP